MARRRTEGESFTMPGSENEEVSQSDTSEYQSATKERKQRLGVFVPLTVDGELDSARVKDQAKLEQARAALASGVTSEPSEDASKAKREQAQFMVPFLLEGYTMLLKQGMRLAKWPEDFRAHIRFPERRL